MVDGVHRRHQLIFVETLGIKSCLERVERGQVLVDQLIADEIRVLVGRFLVTSCCLTSLRICGTSCSRTWWS
jgi:predicted transcriptional regulator of viral defense system